MTEAPMVTMSVEELAKLVKHSDQTLFWFNLQRDAHRFHRCLKIQLYEPGDGPELRFEVQEDNVLGATVTLKLADIFGLLPRLASILPRLEAFLKTQVDVE